MTRPSPLPHCETGSCTHQGRRARNEDCVLQSSLDSECGFLIVCDGMGGHRGGQYASTRAASVMERRILVDRDLRAAVDEANRVLFEESHADAELHGMGTTAIIVRFDALSAEIAHVGDSRAYLVTKDGIRQVTVDHTVAQESTGSNVAAQSEAFAAALTRGVGTEASLEPDIIGLADLPAEWAIVVCTDGVYRSVAEDILCEAAASAAPASSAASWLVSKAFAEGSTDNMSVGLLRSGTMWGNPLPPHPTIEELHRQWRAQKESESRTPPFAKRRAALHALAAGAVFVATGGILLWIAMKRDASPLAIPSRSPGAARTIVAPPPVADVNGSAKSSTAERSKQHTATSDTLLDETHKSTTGAPGCTDPFDATCPAVQARSAIRTPPKGSKRQRQ